MKCLQCKSDKTYRVHVPILDHLWQYRCLVCDFSWLKSKFDAPGIAYAVSIKRETVKGHYRTVVRDQFGKIITSKKWSWKDYGLKQRRVKKDE